MVVEDTAVAAEDGESSYGSLPFRGANDSNVISVKVPGKDVRAFPSPDRRHSLSSVSSGGAFPTHTDLPSDADSDGYGSLVSAGDDAADRWRWKEFGAQLAQDLRRVAEDEKLKEFFRSRRKQWVQKKTSVSRVISSGASIEQKLQRLREEVFLLVEKDDDLFQQLLVLHRSLRSLRCAEWRAAQEVTPDAPGRLEGDEGDDDEEEEEEKQHPQQVGGGAFARSSREAAALTGSLWNLSRDDPAAEYLSHSRSHDALGPPASRPRMPCRFFPDVSSPSRLLGKGSVGAPAAEGAIASSGGTSAQIDFPAVGFDSCSLESEVFV